MSKTVTVRVPDKLNLEQCQKVLVAVLTKAGHTQLLLGIQNQFRERSRPR
jgi:hypothetical protein